MCEEAMKKYSREYGDQFMETWDEFCTVLTICNTVVVSSQPEITNGTLEETLYGSISRDNTYDNEDAFHTPPAGSFRKQSLPELGSPLRNGGIANHRDNRSKSVGPAVVIQAATPQQEPLGITDQNGDVDFFNVSEQRRVRVYSKHISDRLSKSIESINSWLNYNLVPVYEYESPDEGALVKAATCYGYKLANRTPDQIFFATPSGELKIYDILQVLSFDSARKRMSIIVRDDNGKIKVYSKGADTAILNRLRQDEGNYSGYLYLKNRFIGTLIF